MKKIIPLLLSLVLTACGGGGDESLTIISSKPIQKVLLPATENPEDYKSEHSLYMLSNSDTNPQQSVSIQSKFSGDAILWIGATKGVGFSMSKSYIDSASTYGSKFKYVYLYDELFWEEGKIEIGKNEDNILEVAKYAREKGIKPALSIMPYVIFDNNFKMKEINSYDVIAIDIYPSIMPSTDTKGCQYSKNLYTNLLYCSQKKLRDLGYRGQVWYIYQAMGLHGEDEKELIEKLKLQKQTIESAQEIGIEGLIAYGYYLSKGAIDSEPVLYQGYGSVIDEYVNINNIIKK